MWRKVWASAMVSGNTLVQRRSTGEGPLLGDGIEAPNQPCRIKEEKSKASYDCPQCGRNKVKRTSTAIWSCRKCGYTFAGGSFLPETSLGRSVLRSLKKSLEAD